MPEAAVPQSFTLDVEELGGTAVVRCGGKLLAEYADLLYLPVSGLIPKHQRIVLDLCDLTQMDSMGLGVLARLYVSGKTKGCTIELRNLGKKVRDLLIMTNLISVFANVTEYNARF